MTRIILNGASGRMGKAVKEALGEGSLPARLCGEADIKDGTHLSDVRAAGHVVLDFSSASAAEETIGYCLKKRYPLLLAVTGELPMESIRQAAEEIPLMVCPNVSQGAEVLRQLTEHAHALLGEEYDRTVIELHHREKKDAPSGTAKVLLEALDAGNERAVSIRAGQYPGMHRVLFSGPWDSLEIIHTVFDRKLFAHSAVRAACFLSRCAPGLYDIRDALLSPFCES